MDTFPIQLGPLADDGPLPPAVTGEEANARAFSDRLLACLGEQDRPESRRGAPGRSQIIAAMLGTAAARAQSSADLAGSSEGAPPLSDAQEPVPEVQPRSEMSERRGGMRSLLAPVRTIPAALRGAVPSFVEPMISQVVVGDAIAQAHDVLAQLPSRFSARFAPDSLSGSGAPAGPVSPVLTSREGRSESFPAEFIRFGAPIAPAQPLVSAPILGIATEWTGRPESPQPFGFPGRVSLASVLSGSGATEPTAEEYAVLPPGLRMALVFGLAPGSIGAVEPESDQGATLGGGPSSDVSTAKTAAVSQRSNVSPEVLPRSAAEVRHPEGGGADITREGLEPGVASMDPSTASPESLLARVRSRPTPLAPSAGSGGAPAGAADHAELLSGTIEPTAVSQPDGAQSMARAQEAPQTRPAAAQPLADQSDASVQAPEASAANDQAAERAAPEPAMIRDAGDLQRNGARAAAWEALPRTADASAPRLVESVGVRVLAAAAMSHAPEAAASAASSPSGQSEGVVVPTGAAPAERSGTEDVANAGITRDVSAYSPRAGAPGAHQPTEAPDALRTYAPEPANPNPQAASKDDTAAPGAASRPTSPTPHVTAPASAAVPAELPGETARAVASLRPAPDTEVTRKVGVDAPPAPPQSLKDPTGAHVETAPSAATAGSHAQSDESVAEGAASAKAPMTAGMAREPMVQYADSGAAAKSADSAPMPVASLSTEPDSSSQLMPTGMRNETSATSATASPSAEPAGRPQDHGLTLPNQAPDGEANAEPQPEPQPQSRPQPQLESKPEPPTQQQAEPQQPKSHSQPQVDSPQFTQESHPGREIARPDAGPIASDIEGHAQRQAAHLSSPQAPAQLEIIEQIARAARAELRPGHSELTLRLDPPSLGAVSMRVVSQGSAMTAHLEASVEASRDLITASLPALKEALAAQGINISHFSVTVGGGEHQDPTQGQGLPPRWHGATANPGGGEAVEAEAAAMAALRVWADRGGQHFDAFA